MRAQFVVSEVAIGLRRNLTMSIATVITVGVALVLAGVGYFMYDTVQHTKAYYDTQLDVQVYLTSDVTQADRDAIGAKLASLPGVESVHYVSQQEAYQIFVKDFAGEPELVHATVPSSLPESFDIKLQDPSRFDIIVSAMQNQPGVQEVATQSKVLKQIFRLFNALELSSWIVAALGLLAGILLVYNATRVAAFSRRRETGIMRLVGASNAYIQLPFVLEGALAGAVGALLADAGLALVKAQLLDRVLKPSLKFIIFFDWGAVAGTAVFLLVFGVVFTSLASALSLRRHLAV
ncbi:MAG TPA: permease-like cell division protein FtsX [Mycobacteriales bacterium]|nr:permease-like cell division protein FtsX [Mycobacteriales bacterium]